MPRVQLTAKTCAGFLARLAVAQYTLPPDPSPDGQYSCYETACPADRPWLSPISGSCYATQEVGQPIRSLTAHDLREASLLFCSLCRKLTTSSAAPFLGEPQLKTRTPTLPGCSIAGHASLTVGADYPRKTAPQRSTAGTMARTWRLMAPVSLLRLHLAGIQSTGIGGRAVSRAYL